MLGMKCRRSRARLLLLPLLVALGPLTGMAQTPPPLAIGKGGGDAGTGVAIASPPKPWVCPPERRVTVLPRVLKKKLSAAKESAEVKKLLEPLQLGLPWDRFGSCIKQNAPASVTLDVFRARLLSAETEDFVLQARGSVCDNVLLLAGVVAHPLEEKNLYCLMKMPFLPGMNESYAPTVVFAFENLTHPLRHVIKVDSEEGQPSSMQYALSYWEAQGGSLEKIFGLEWSSGSDALGSGGSSVEVSAEGKAFPRQLLLKESTGGCKWETIELPSGKTEAVSNCDEASSEAVYCYKPTGSQGPGGYTECGRKSPDL